MTHIAASVTGSPTDSVGRSAGNRSSADRRAVRALAIAEGRRHLTSAALWLGVVATIWSVWSSSSIDWSAGPYMSFTPDFVILAWVVFVLGAIAGGRDTARTVGSPLAEESALGAPERAIARLLGLSAPIAVGTLVVLGVVMFMRIEGGYWIGDQQWRTDVAQHSLPEVLQPTALFMLCAAAGVAAGAFFRRRASAIVVGTLALFTFGFVYWAWQSVPIAYLTPIQAQPFMEPLGGVDVADVPPTWLLNAPDADQGGWRRVVISPAVAAWHDVYLVGLTAVFAGLAIRRHLGRRLIGAGLVVVAVAIAAQVMVSPV